MRLNSTAIIDSYGGGSIYIGDNTIIHHGAMILTYGGHIKIGCYCSINPYCIIYGHGNLVIGDNVAIAAHTIIIPANHCYTDIEKPICQQGMSQKGIIIEDDVWIGSSVKILDGIRIKKGCVIGAGSVVTKSTEEYGVYTGVPAKKIKDRKTQGSITCQK